MFCFLRTQYVQVHNDFRRININKKFNRNEEQNDTGIVMMIHNHAVKIQCKTVISNVVQLCNIWWIIISNYNQNVYCKYVFRNNYRYHYLQWYRLIHWPLWLDWSTNITFYHFIGSYIGLHSLCTYTVNGTESCKIGGKVNKCYCCKNTLTLFCMGIGKDKMTSL